MAPKRGGRVQRLARAAETKPPSNVVSCLLPLFAWGHISPQQVQTITKNVLLDLELAKKDELLMTDLEICAAIGSQGSSPQWCHSQLMRAIRPSVRSQTHKVPFKAKNPLGYTYSDQSIFEPHTMFADIYHHYPLAWKKHILPDKTALNAFWDDMRDHPAMLNHPVKDRADYRDKAIPIFIHGDGVPVTAVNKAWSKSCDNWTWGSILGRGSFIECMYYIWGSWPKFYSTSFAHNTMTVFFEILTWSLHWLWLGEWPTHDWKGTPIAAAGRKLANGHYAVLLVLKGDLDYFNKSLRLPHYGSNNPCSWCRCNTSDIPWNDWRKNAALWVGTIWQPGPWALSPRNLNKLFTLPGVSVLNVAPDWMHMKYLGVDQYLFGSVLYALCYILMPRGASA